MRSGDKQIPSERVFWIVDNFFNTKLFNFRYKKTFVFDQIRLAIDGVMFTADE